MKFATSMLSMLAAPLTGGAGKAMIRLGISFVVAVALFSAGFHVIMEMEGRDFSWWTSIYWTLVTMSTLGFGDIVFTSDLGRMYSVVVLLTGALLILILLPFTFIQLVYVPWSRAIREAKAPRRLPTDLRDHLILTDLSPMDEALIRRAETSGVPYVLLVEDPERAATLHDDGYRVMVGQLDEPETYRNARADAAAMLVATRTDQTNTNIAFTMREVTGGGVVAATANSPDAVDVLELAGVDHVMQLGELLGRAFARRILAPTAQSSVISTFEDLVIAETSAGGTPLVGQSLRDLDLRHRFGVSVVGLWDRGSLQLASPDLVIEEESILLLAGRQEQLDAYDTAFTPRAPGPGLRSADDVAPVLILGGGRVGRATATALAEAGIPARVVDRLAERIAHLEGHVVGDAADLAVLKRAGIDDASAVVVTTHDDDTNIYLTLYSRRLRPDIEVLGRVVLERNVSTMHRAGADFVLSYASIGAIDAWNVLRDDSTLLLAEGLVVFRVPMPRRLAGRILRGTDIPARTACSIIGIADNGRCTTTLDPDAPLPADGDLILIGDDEAEERFFAEYVAELPRRRIRELLSDR